VGDEITIEGPKQVYNGTVELVNVSVIKISKSLIKVDSLSISDATLPVEGGDITAVLSCKGDGVTVKIPEEAKDWLFMTSMIAGSAPEVKFHALENKGADREATIVFTTKSSGKEYTAQTTIKQKGVAKGSGTDTDPFNVAAVLNYTKALGADVVSEKDVYVKGIISSVKYTYSADFGTATYNISDDGTESGVFTVYGSYYYDNQPWVEGNEQIKVGDEVIVVGKVIYYKGTTPEFSNKQNWLFSLNGKTSSVTATVAEFLAAAEDDTRYSLTGVVTSLYESDKQGKSFYIKDFSGEALVYRTDGFLDTGIKVGDVVTVVGKRGSYKNNPQMVNGNCALEHAVTPVTIAEFLTKPDDKNTYYMVTGKISSLLGSNGKENDYGNLYITDGTNELYVYGTYPGWGATGDFRKFFIADNGLQVGDEITIIGYKDTYKELVELCQGVCFSFKKAN
jgi:RPA family protein